MKAREFCPSFFIFVCYIIHMKMKYTFDIVKIEAQKYLSRKDFESKSRPFYAAAHRNGWLTQVCAHMILSKKLRWLESEIRIEAQKYSTKLAFEQSARGAYKAALNLGIIDSVCAHMHRPNVWNKKWNENSIYIEAKKYSTKMEWRVNSPGSYLAAHKLKIVKKITSHMRTRSAPNKFWTFEKAISILSKCTSRTEFQQSYPGAYDFLLKKRLLESGYESIGLKPMSGTSIMEQDLFNWVKSIQEDALSHFRLNNSKQLDIYVPSLKIGIEFCGLYWHSEAYIDKNYHYQKMQAANAQGIRLITIFEHEWTNRKDQVKNFLASILSKATQIIYARKCTIKAIPKFIAKEFLNLYHIQGAANSIVYFGLFFNEELLGIISGGKHHRETSKNELVLDRLCFKTGTSVLGGSSKLLKTLVEYAKTNHYPCITSWSDRRWSQGNVYEKMGFSKFQELRPDYFYTKSGCVYSKQSMKKKTHEKQSGLTEYELRKAEGYNRIWDCGKIKWRLIVD